MLQEKLAQQQRAYAIVEAHNKVLWGVYREQSEGTMVPLPAVMERMNLETKVATQEFGES